MERTKGKKEGAWRSQGERRYPKGFIQTKAEMGGWVRRTIAFSAADSHLQSEEGSFSSSGKTPKSNRMAGSTYANALFDELRRRLQACTTECEERMPSAEREKEAEDAEGGTREGKAQVAGMPPFCVSGRSAGKTHKPCSLNGSAHRWQKENQWMQRGVISETGEGGNKPVITALGPLCR